MSSDEVKANYEELDQVASKFASQAEAAQQVLQQVLGSMDPLVNGGWIGRAANQFFSEMDSEVLPACRRLISVLHDAAQATKDISETMHRAEDEASAPFRAR